MHATPLRSPRAARGPIDTLALSALPSAFLGALLVALPACSGGGSTDAPETPESLAIDPPSPTLADATALELTATAIYADGRVVDVTDAVVWSSRDATVVSVASGGADAGLLGAQAPGSAVVSASLAGAVATTTATVSDAAFLGFELAPETFQAAAGTGFSACAYGTFDDASVQALTALGTWSSTDTSVASVSNAPGSKGLIRVLAPGTVTIHASLLGQGHSFQLTATAAELSGVQIEPPQTSLILGTRMPLAVSGVFDDDTVQDLRLDASWSSADEDVASVLVDADGRATLVARGVGSTTVTCTVGALSAGASVVVTAPTLARLAIEAEDAALDPGATTDLVAIGLYSDGSHQDLTRDVRWSSADEALAVVSNAPHTAGRLYALASGTALVHAELDGTSATLPLAIGASALVALALDPPALVLPVGGTACVRATGTYADGSVRDVTALVQWSSATPSVCTVSNATGEQGRATGVAAGATTLTALLGASQASAAVTVRNAVLSALTIEPAMADVQAGVPTRLTATGLFSDGSHLELSDQVSWSSAGPTTAAIANHAGAEGVLVPLAAGATTVRASFAGVLATSSIDVAGAALVSLSVDPPLATLAAGTSGALRATATYADNSVQDVTALVTWESDDDALIVVRSLAGREGELGSESPGSAAVRATLSGLSASADVTVTSAVLVSITLAPDSLTLAAGTSAELTATGSFSDGSEQDLTDTVVWSSDDAGVAHVGNAVGSRGLLSALTVGTSQVHATQDGVVASVDVTVTPAELVSMAITPGAPLVAVGGTVQLSATGTYTDASTQDLTGAVTWTVDDGGVAAVSNASGSEGLLTGIASGSTSVHAAIDLLDFDVPVVVTPAALVSIDVTPLDQSLTIGDSLAYTAIGTYSDGASLDLTDLCAWSTTDASVASASNAPGTRGLVTGLKFGLVFVYADLDDVRGATFLIVVP